MLVASILVTTAVSVVVSTAYTLYTTREGRREDREFTENMKTRIQAIKSY
jgi:hypothetical protein